MIVDRETYEPLPVAHNLLTSSEGEVLTDLHLSDVAFSNEMIEHHIEIRTGDAVESFADLHKRLHRGLQRFNDLLSGLHAALLPGAMHPFLDPADKTQLWQEKDVEVYEKYDELFNVHRHGAGNIQSCRLLVPYYDDREFAIAHNLGRMILPLIPALAAGSPVYDGQVHECADCRLHFYNTFHENYPEIAGGVIPEVTQSTEEYRQKVLEPIRQALGQADPQGIMPAEWLNARGIVPRFERQFLEIRLIDTQESIFSCCAVSLLIFESLRYLANCRQDIYQQILQFPTDQLRQLYEDAVIRGENCEIKNSEYLHIFNIHAASLTGKEFWLALLERTRLAQQFAEYAPFYELYSQEGSFASRLLKHFDLVRGEKIQPGKLKKICRELMRCLQQNEPLIP